MSKWQFTKKGVPTTDPIFDDGDLAMPGDQDFNTDAPAANLPSGADGFNYMGASADTAEV